MTVSDQVRNRVEDLVALQPTKNKALQDRWGLDSGSEVHAYLESELEEYYYRDDDSLIRATPKAERLVGTDGRPVSINAFQATILDVLAPPENDSMSVVATLHALQETGADPDVAAVRSALRGLADRGLVEVVERTVPTYRLAVPREELAVEVGEEDGDDQASGRRPDVTQGRPDQGDASEDVEELVVDLFDDSDP